MTPDSVPKKPVGRPPAPPAGRPPPAAAAPLSAQPPFGCPFGCLVLLLPVIGAISFVIYEAPAYRHHGGFDQNPARSSSASAASDLPLLVFLSICAGLYLLVFFALESRHGRRRVLRFALRDFLVISGVMCVVGALVRVQLEQPGLAARVLVAMAFACGFGLVTGYFCANRLEMAGRRGRDLYALGVMLTTYGLLVLGGFLFGGLLTSFGTVQIVLASGLFLLPLPEGSVEGLPLADVTVLFRFCPPALLLGPLLCRWGRRLAGRPLPPPTPPESVPPDTMVGQNPEDLR